MQNGIGEVYDDLLDHGHCDRNGKRAQPSFKKIIVFIYCFSFLSPPAMTVESDCQHLNLCILDTRCTWVSNASEFCLHNPLMYHFHHIGRPAWFRFDSTIIFCPLVLIRCVNTRSDGLLHTEYARCYERGTVGWSRSRDLMKVEPVSRFSGPTFSLELIDIVEVSIWDTPMKGSHFPPSCSVSPEKKYWIPGPTESWS